MRYCVLKRVDGVGGSMMFQGHGMAHGYLRRDAALGLQRRDSSVGQAAFDGFAAPWGN
jgi:hypothetical protein